MGIHGYPWVLTYLPGFPNGGTRVGMKQGMRAGIYPRGGGWGLIPCLRLTPLTSLGGIVNGR